MSEVNRAGGLVLGGPEHHQDDTVVSHTIQNFAGRTVVHFYESNEVSSAAVLGSVSHSAYDSVPQPQRLFGEQ